MRALVSISAALLAGVAVAGDPLPPGAVARCGVALLRHPGIDGEDDSFAFRPDGRAIASRDDNTVRLWDVADGKRLWEFDARTHFHRILFSPDGKRLAVVAQTGVLLVDTATGKLDRTVKAPAGSAAAFAPDGRTLATTRDDWGQPVELWDLTTGDRTAELAVEKHGKSQALGISADGKVLSASVWGTRDGSAAVWVASWDLATRERRPDFDPHVRMWSYRLSPDGRLLGTRTFADHPVAVWDVLAGKSVGRLDVGHGHFNFGPDGKLVTSTRDNKARTTHVGLWDTTTGQRIRDFAIPNRLGEQALLSPDGKLIATSQRGEMLCPWDAATGERRLGGTAHDHQVTGLAFALGGRTLITGSDGDVRTWDAATGARLGSLPPGTRRIAVLPGGRELIGHSGGLRRIDIATGKPVGEPLAPPTLAGALPGDTFQLYGAVGPADGRSVVGQGSLRGPGRKNPLPYVVIWDTRSGKPTAEYALPDTSIDALSPDGWVAGRATTTTRPNTDPASKGYFPTEYLTDVKSLDLPTGRVLSAFRVPQEYRFHLGLSADGQTLALLSSMHGAVPVHPPANLDLRLFEVRTGKGRRAISLKAPAHYDPATVALSADGRLVAVSRLANRIDIFDVATGRELVVRTGFESSAYTLAFRADGRRIASGHTDGTVLVWDVPAPPTAALDAAAREAAWADLASEDAGKADAASWALAGSPATAVKLLADRVKPADPAVVERATARIADLDSKSFPIREAAGRELASLVEIADPVLQAALRGKQTDEQAARLKRVLEPPAVVRSPDLLRTLRGIETLERIGTPEAAAVLRKLADGPADLRPTREARAALDRVTVRAAESK